MIISNFLINLQYFFHLIDIKLSYISTQSTSKMKLMIAREIVATLVGDFPTAY